MTDTKPLTRDEIRAKIFGAKPQTETVDDFFGVTIELRQPTLSVALTQREVSDEERLYFMLTDYAFVPGTNEKVFEPADIANIKQLPFSGDFRRLMDAVNALLGTDPEEVEAAIADAEKSA
jgi:hypothetical protein